MPIPSQNELIRMLSALEGVRSLVANIDPEDNEEEEALWRADGAYLALQWVLGYGPPVGLAPLEGLDQTVETLVDMARSRQPRQPNMPNDYTIRLALYRGGGGVWEEVFKRDTYTSRGTPENAATDIVATTTYLQYEPGNPKERPWRVTVQAGHHAGHLDPILHTIYAKKLAKRLAREARSS